MPCQWIMVGSDNSFFTLTTSLSPFSPLHFLQAVTQLAKVFGPPRELDAVVQPAEADSVGGQLTAQCAFAQMHDAGDG